MIYQAKEKDLVSLAALGVQLWPVHGAAELVEEFARLMQQGTAFFVAADPSPIGFAQVGLRHDYVEGTQSSPVGYLEGVFVKEQCRKQGVGRALVAACEAWAKAQGCTQFASDCQLCNSESLAFHLSLGFAEANRIICFSKDIR